MSRRAMIWTGVAFLAAALALQGVGLFLQAEAPRAGMIAAAGLRALAIYALCTIVALVIWAFARFRLEDALGPVVIWGGLVVLASGAAAAAGNLPLLFDRLMDQPQFSRSFRASFARSTTQSCVKTIAANPRSTLTAGQAQAYCGCVAERLAESLSGREIGETLQNHDQLSPALRARATMLARSCVGEILRQPR